MFKTLFRLIVLHTLIQQGVVAYILSNTDPKQTLQTSQNRARRGIQQRAENDHDSYTVQHVIEDGIERISYIPHNKKFDTPILMQHGMWHGAWCWENWQHLLAEWGWESHAISLPGHGKSPKQLPLWRCTLDYYLSFLKDEVERLPTKPVLMGHSMGGALTQWYLRYVGDDLPAAVLVAPWVAHSTMADGLSLIARQDPLALLLTSFQWNASSWVRNPRRAAEKLISHDAVIKPIDLYNRLGGESALVVMQHNPPFWHPAENVRTPMLWLSGEKDAVVSEAGQRRSAAHYGADYHMVANAAHNLMMEKSYVETAQFIHDWLINADIS